MTKAQYKPVSKALPIMPDTHKADIAKGTVPQAHRVPLEPSDYKRSTVEHGNTVHKVQYSK